MTTFSFWERWGIDLDDTAFANAWSALGVAAATRTTVKSPFDHLGAALAHGRDAGGLVSWRFPDPDAGWPRDVGPRAWAEAWAESVRAYRAHLRLRVTGAPGDEPLVPWYRLLGESNPAPAAASLELAAPGSAEHVEWPLRLGAFPQSPAAELIERARSGWVGETLARAVTVERGQSNCDLLIFDGGARALLARLLAQSFSLKANVILLIGSLESDWAGERIRLATALSETHAGGFVLLEPGTSPGDLAGGLDRLIAELSHAETFDVAVARSFGSDPRRDVIAGFTPPMAAFRIRDIVPRINMRMKAMPPDSTLDLSRLGHASEWLTRGVNGGGRRGGEAMAAPPGEDRHVAARTVEIEAAEMRFDHEYEGATTLAAMTEAVAAGAEQPEATVSASARYLQQQSFVRTKGELLPAEQGFVAGEPAIVRVRIGPPDAKWDALAQPFPVEALPEHLEWWNLSVWLTEPNHLPRPLRQTLRLPRAGPSNECEFRFRPLGIPEFEARLTVLHRGRVLQTAVLRAGVRIAGKTGSPQAAPRLEEVIPVRAKIGDLRARREFDLAFVLNDTAAGRPLANGLSRDHAWLVNLTESLRIAKEVNGVLSRVAKSVVDYAGGLDSDKGRELLVELARKGRWLHLYLIEQQINASGNRPDIAAREYIQVVSTKTEAVVPFEFIYEYETPEPAAQLCPRWRQSLRDGACPSACDKKASATVCPMGFWGVSKVIERHALTPQIARDGREIFLQSETDSLRSELKLGGKAVYGSSGRVARADLVPLGEHLDRATGAKSEYAADWKRWESLVTQLKPALLIALPHTDGIGHAVSLELGGKTIETIDVKASFVRPDPQQAQPLVALLGCDVAGTADDYGNHVLVFRSRGAAVVVGTIATVFGQHAARVATQLVDGLLPDGGRAAGGPLRLGESLRQLKREALLDDLLMPLCLVAYGDADWLIKR